MSETTGGADPQRARIAWRCRRGMKELDLLLLGWLQQRYEQATQAERGCFEALLELPDPQLAAYLLGHETPAEAAQAALVERLRASRRLDGNFP